MKIGLFQSCGHCWVFQIFWHIECSTFTASSFRIWNSSTGVPSLPLALFIVMLPKARLTLHSRMSGSRWVITPSWLSGSWRSFLYSSSVYFCHLFLISSVEWRRTLIFIGSHTEKAEMGGFTKADVTRAIKVYEDPRTKWVKKGRNQPGFLSCSVSFSYTLSWHLRFMSRPLESDTFLNNMDL